MLPAAIYVADWTPGVVYHFTSSGNLLGELDIPLTQLSDLHLRADGLLSSAPARRAVRCEFGE